MATRAAARFLQRRLLCSGGKVLSEGEKAAANIKKMEQEKLEELALRKEIDTMLSDLKEVKSNIKASNNANHFYWKLAVPMAVMLALGVYSNQCKVDSLMTHYLDLVKEQGSVEDSLTEDPIHTS